MQPDRFTVKSQEAVAAAQQRAATRRNSEVAPAHLLLALVQQEDGLVAPILRKTGTDPAAVGTGANEAIEALPKLSGDEQPEVRPSSAFLAVLQGAEREMGKLGDEYISTDHVLLALTDSGSGVSDLLPEPAALEKAIGEVRPQRVTTPEPESTAQALVQFGVKPDLTPSGEQSSEGLSHSAAPTRCGRGRVRDGASRSPRAARCRRGCTRRRVGRPESRCW